jgi:rhodanese-related sulfurtransferase
MKRMILIIFALCISSGLLLGQRVRNIDPQEAWELLEKPGTYLVDVRTIAEYVYVGHPEKAYNIPLLFWNEKKQERERNPLFLDDVKSRFKPDDTLILICRSVAAYRLLNQAGFTDLYNITRGFEGERDENGYRIVNGWKNSGVPYSYSLDPKLTYKFPQE